MEEQRGTGVRVRNGFGPLQERIKQLESLLSGRNKAEKELKASEVKYRRLFETALDGILILDGNTGKIKDVNPYLIRMLGYSNEEILGKRLWELGAFKDVGRSKEAYKELQSKEYIRYENLPLETKDGRLFAVEFVSNVYTVDHTRVIQCNIRDITEKEQLKQKLQEMATHDALTGLPNRLMLNDRFSVALAQAKREKKRVSIMTLDLDKFKMVNDTLGHAKGDRLLVESAARLARSLRQTDSIARLGGDEFVVLLTEVERKGDTVKVAQKILDEFRRPFNFEEHELNITTSIGIALFPEDGNDLEALLISSDRAMYRVKENGGNDYRFSP
ncbi:MAG: sensor domain-containing diguanylate cyclase [Dehalococcoidia bacterium]|jgi:diguanylate cyclase (GGDEF)-like protein/PAS domain S-box-containing protein